jgi:hypothetical protein
MAAEDIDLDAAPEEGLAAQVAQAADELAAARKKAAAAEKLATDKKAALDELSQRLQTLEETGVDGAVPLDRRKALQADLKDAEVGAEKAYRRAVKAKVKADDAARAVGELNPAATPEAEPSKDD